MIFITRLLLVCGFLPGLFLSDANLFAQGKFSGGLQAQSSVFIRDTAIGATNTPQYDNLFSGSEGWLDLNYSNWGFNIGLRFDFYQNSNVPDPQDAFNGQGIGYWYINKKIQKLEITAGHFYDQIGSGIIFRAYEDRFLAIDNALIGLRLKYNLSENWNIKAMLGKQRDPFGSESFFSRTYQPVINTFSTEGFIQINEKISLSPGAGFVNRVLDDASMDLIVAEINTYTPIDSFVPAFNVYAFTVFNTLNIGDISWYVEGAYKTPEALLGNNSRLFKGSGSVIYSSLTYSRNGLGITFQGKRTQNFTLKTSPNEILNDGAINFLPTSARQNTKRLLSRYNANTQELGEVAFQIDILFKPFKKSSALINFANITDLDGNLLFREFLIEGEVRKFGAAKKWTIGSGFQFVEYNQSVYEVKPGVPNVKSFVPFIDILYKIDKKKSLRSEIQYQHTLQDFGSFFYILGELTLAPHWSFSLSDMINIAPKKTESKQQYYSAAISYSNKANKISLGFFRQVEGIVCTGGVCRFEPAFNGFRATVNSSF